jgi:hypothetical protein
MAFCTRVDLQGRGNRSSVKLSSACNSFTISAYSRAGVQRSLVPNPSYLISLMLVELAH